MKASVLLLAIAMLPIAGYLIFVGLMSCFAFVVPAVVWGFLSILAGIFVAMAVTVAGILVLIRK